MLERDDFSSNRHPALAYWWSMIFFRKPVSTFRDHALLPHHQHRTLGVAHHVAGIGAEEVGTDAGPMRPVRTHHDEVGIDRARLVQNFLMDAALAHDR